MTRLDLISEAQGHICYLCGGAFGLDLPATREHVVPRAKGGQTIGNCLAACLPCNGAKGDRDPTPNELAILAAINAVLDVRPQRHRAPAVGPKEMEKRRLFAEQMEAAKAIRLARNGMSGIPAEQAQAFNDRQKAAAANERARVAIVEGRGFGHRPFAEIGPSD